MASGQARLAMGSGLGIWVLEVPDGFGDPGFHAHHALQLTYCLEGTLALECQGRRMAAPAIAVDADARHRIEASGLLALVFVEPESRQGRSLRQRLFADFPLAEIGMEEAGTLAETLRGTFTGGLSSDQLLQAAQVLVGALAGEGGAEATDPRIRKIMAFAEAHIDRPLTLAAAAEGVYLSPSRLRHLFVEETGLPFKTWLLWLRLVRALQVYSAGATLTASAHEAGFADSAHFSRIFKRTFGLPATTLTRV